MSSLRTPIVRIVLAGVRQRTRGTRFLAVLAVAAYLGYLVTGGPIDLIFDQQYTAEPNAASFGTVTALGASIFVLLFGFYLVKDALALDRRTGVSEHVEAAPISARSYLFSAWLSNVAVLGIVLVVMVLSALIVHVSIDGAVTDLLALLTPFLVVTLPIVLLVAAIALLFETLPVLRGTVGNVVYFVASLVLLVASVGLMMVSNETLRSIDPMGYGLVVSPMIDALEQQAAFDGGVVFGTTEQVPTETFVWEGLAVSPELLAGRLVLVAVALLLVGCSVVTYSVFDGRRDGGITGSDDDEQDDEPTPDPASDAEPRLDDVPIPDLSIGADAERSFGVGRALRAELRLLVRGRRRLWSLGAVGLIVAGLVSPASTGRALVLPIVALWLLPVLSELGLRERRHGTESFVLSSPTPVRQLLVVWAAGVAVTAALVSGVVVGLALAGDGGGVLAVAVGAAFVPSLAIACGTLSGTERLFEGSLLFLWYAGSLNGVAALDVIGSTPGAASYALIHAIVAVGLLSLAVVARVRRTSR